MRFRIGDSRILLQETIDFAFQRKVYDGLELTDACASRVEAARAVLTDHLERKLPIYGVTTGFGDSCKHPIEPEQSEILQKNLVSYLLVGTGTPMPRPAVRAMCVARLASISRGHSGVSWELIQQLGKLIEHDLLPIVPCEGSLGASGDLVPLAYLAEVVQGGGTVSTPLGDMPTAEAFKKHRMAPYKLKPKEGLALVNGTSSMVGMAMHNVAGLRFVTELAQFATAWLCLAIGGRTEAFSVLVNEKAKLHHGQRDAARRIRTLLDAEGYVPQAAPRTGAEAAQRPVQDRYSLRCAPQILGPVVDTLATFDEWLELELNSVSDNPLFDADDASMATGGNFYGGYLGHGMDYFKICVANVVDMLDRQVMLMFDPKTANGLAPNLANWGAMSASERHLHHGLKGLHQVTNALTSEVCSMTMPSTVFSRSSECHNQDKVSLGMSAAMGCHAMLEKTFSVTALTLSCMAQALDLRGQRLKGTASAELYQLVRRHVPFADRDMALGREISALTVALKDMALRRGTLH